MNTSGEILAKLQSDQQLSESEALELIQALTSELRLLKEKDPQTYLKVVKEVSSEIESLNRALA